MPDRDDNEKPIAAEPSAHDAAEPATSTGKEPVSPGKEGSTAPTGEKPKPLGKVEAAAHFEELVVITGFSGAGKSEAIACFEDAGFFCVDNLPPRLIGALADVFQHEGSKVERAAVVSDVRGGDYFEEIQQVLDELKERGLHHRVVFLEAGEAVLLRRFNETRRRHPLVPRGRVVDGIRAEIELLEPLRKRADVVIDTSDLTPAMLRQRISGQLLPGGTDGKLAVTLLSFGYKHGTPRDADLIFDVRFLRNPFYEKDLRELTGRDERVIEYVDSSTDAKEFYERVTGLIEFLLPAYIEEGKAHLIIAVGCTGGRHRSVVVADRLVDLLKGRDDSLIEVVHRDIDRLR